MPKKFTIPLFSAVLGIIGVVLPWVTVSMGRQSRSVSGWDSKHGLLFIGAFATVAILAAVLRTKTTGSRLFSGILAVAGIGLAIMAYSDLQNIRGSISMVSGYLGKGLKVEVGMGLWIVLGAGVAVALGAIIDLVTTPREEETPILSLGSSSPRSSAAPPREPPEAPLEVTPATGPAHAAQADDAPLSVPLSTVSAPSAVKHCPECGAQVENDMPFCPTCAAPL